MFLFTRQSLKACAVLAPLLGFTWMFGVLTVTDVGLVFQYIFTVLNSLQVHKVKLCCVLYHVPVSELKCCCSNAVEAVFFFSFLFGLEITEYKECKI